MLLKNRKNTHIKNTSSALPTGRSKGTVAEKSTSKEKSKDRSKQKLKPRQLSKRMSFQSPSRKEQTEGGKNFSLLNYMIFKQKTMKLNSPAHEQSSKLTRENFQVLQVLGKGGFGKVMKVQHKKGKKLYAMKQMSKAVIITKKSIPLVLNERQILADLHHSFLVNMVYAFQDRQNLYLIMDLMPGGDLRYQIGRYETFPEHIVKFFVCCIIVGLEYIHSNNIIHRDIKPQNLVLDEKGYLRVTDMGIAKIMSPQNYKDTSGTPGYMAPQVINRQNHTFAADFFAVGVIAYECMLGRRPYKGYNRQEIKQQILLFEAVVKIHQIPNGWDLEAGDFITRMLRRKQEERLGFKGIEQIKGHPWFRDIDWNQLTYKRYPSPFMPNLDERNYDTVSVSEYEQEYLERMYENGLLLKEKSTQQLFKGYEYQQVKFL